MKPQIKLAEEERQELVGSIRKSVQRLNAHGAQIWTLRKTESEPFQIVVSPEQFQNIVVDVKEHYYPEANVRSGKLSFLATSEIPADRIMYILYVTAINLKEAGVMRVIQLK
jgi:hypothetical protein